MVIEYDGAIISIEKIDNCYIGTGVDISGLNSQGDSFEECVENVKEALALIRFANKDLNHV